jgi:hypothetical protein
MKIMGMGDITASRSVNEARAKSTTKTTGHLPIQTAQNLKKV